MIAPLSAKHVLATSFAILAIALALGFANIGRSAPPDQGALFVPDEVLVKFRPGAAPGAITNIAGQHHISRAQQIPGIGVMQMQLSASSGGVEAVVRALRQNPNVQFAEPDYTVSAVNAPNDPYFTGGFQWNMVKVQAPEAWNITTGTPSVAVAILDTGIDLSHPDLQSKVVSSVNFSDSTTATDVNGHGTRVAGIAGAVTNNGIGVAGLGYNTSLLNVKVMGDNGTGGYGWVAQGVIWAADNGARVINMSLGASFGSSTLEAAINYAWSRGVVVVAAAGNSGTGAPFYPAAYPDVIAVASTDMFDNLASSSNYGDWVDVAAPGGNIYSTVNLDNQLQTGGYGVMGGTSMASPHVAGLAGLVFTTTTDQNGNGLLNDEVRSCIEQNADNIGLSGIGSGRINAYRAVACTSGGATPAPAPVATPTPVASLTPTPAPPASPTPAPIPSPTPTPAQVAPDITPPLVTLQQPGTGQIVKGSVSVSASAWDNFGIRKLVFYVDGAPFKSDTSAPYSVSWQTRKWGNGVHTITARAFDAAGNVSEDSHAVTVLN